MSVREKQNDILVVYDGEDSNDWKNYIYNFLNEKDLKLTVKVKNLGKDIDEITSLCSQFTVIILVISPSMLTTMAEQAALLVPCLKIHSCVSVIMLFIEQDQFDSDIKPTYTNSEHWKLFSMSGSDEDNKNMMSEVLDILDNARKARKPGTKPKEGKRDIVGLPDLKPHSKTSILKAVCPDCIRQKGEKVVLVFRNEISDRKLVQVSIGASDAQKIDTKMLNPQCFIFKAPPHTQGKFTLHIFFDGVMAVKSYIRYLSIPDLAYTCPEFLCQLLGLPSDDMKSLDIHLASIYTSSMPNDGALAQIFTPKTLMTASQVSKCSDDLPTLLHFACHYGLHELCTTIMDTPGVSQAFQILNNKDKTPLDLAREANHEDLIDYIETYLEMHDYIGAVQDIYEQMGGRQLAYINNPAAGIKGYMDMGGQEMVAGYTDGRISEDDYVIDWRNKSEQVSEVKPSEDITLPVIPERPPPITRPKLINRSVPAMTGTSIYPAVPPRTLQIRTPPPVPEDEDIFFAKALPMVPNPSGSSSIDELTQLQDSYKKGEFNLDDVEKLFHAWQDRNREGPTSSMKERKEHLQQMKDNYATVLRGAESDTQKKGFFARLKSRKKEQTHLAIQHNVATPNIYKSWEAMEGTGSKSEYGQNRSNRDSTISTTSTTSSSSSGSRSSGLGTISEWDSEPEEEAPPLPDDQRDSRKENRKSMGTLFLQTVQNRPASRLPTPPPLRTTVAHKASTTTITQQNSSPESPGVPQRSSSSSTENPPIPPRTIPRKTSS